MDRSQDSITSWFVRRRLGAAATADGKHADGKAGKRSKQQRKEEQALAAKTKEDGKARPSEGKPVKPQAPEAAPIKEASQRKQEAAPAKPPPQPAQQQQRQEPSKQPGKQQPGSAAGEEKRHHPKGLVAAAAAVADRAKEAVKTAAAAADAEEERQKQQQQPQRAAEPAPSTTAQAAPGADAGREREGEHGPSGGARAHKAALAPPAPAAADKPPAPQRQGGQQAEAAKQEDEDEEAEDRPRVVAYSDSDSDVESHIQRVKHHLLPSKEEEEAAAAAATAAETAAAEAAALAAAAAARLRAPLRRLGRAGAGAAGLVGHAAAQHATPGLALRAGSLLALGRAAPRAATALGALGVAAPLVGAAAGRCGLDLAAALPAPLLTAGQELGQFGKAAAAIAASRLLQAGLRHRRRARQRRRAQRAAAAAAAAKAAAGAEARREDAAADPEPPVVGLLRHKSSVNLAALAAFSDLGAAIEQRQPQTAAEWAQVYASELAEMRRMLQENKVDLPPDRFDGTNAELMRFCKACGLLEAKTPEQRAIAVEAAFSRVVHTAEWVARQRFLTPRELRRWDRLVAWKAHDASGRPILLARLGRAQQLVKPERYDELANALLTLVHRGLTGQLSNAAGAAEQMVVVLDCRGGSSMGLTRHMGLLKRLAITLNEHYPDRLFKLHLLELPLLLRWALHAVMPLLHPHTRSKVVLSSITDPDLAVTVAFLTKRRSSAAKATLRRTMSNCSFLSSGDSTPALLSPQTSLGQAVHGLAAATPEGGPAAACGPEQRHRLSMGHAASAEACIEAPPPALPVPLSRAQAEGREQLGEEDVPHTPPPTLKGPQSPREPGLRARRQLQHRPQQAQQQQQSHEQGRHHPHHPAHHPAPHHQRPEHHSQHSQHSQHALRPALAHEPDRQQQQHVHLEQGRLGQASQELQQLDALQAAAASPPSRRPAPGGGPPQVARPSPFDSIRRSLEEPVAACASEQQPAGSVPLASAGSQPVAPDAGAPQRAATSAASGPSSHAVPWSPGMHSPAGSLSRASSLGEELVPAARAKAAADAARTWEQGQAAASSGSAGAQAPPPAQHGTLLRTESSTASSTGPAAGGAGQCSGRAAAAGSTLAGLSAALAAMLPSRRGSGLPPSWQQRAQVALPRTSSNLSLGSPGSCGGSPCTATSARRLDGLTDLPPQPLGRSRPGRGRGLTPRKSSLRRSQSADCFGAASGRGLGSHPLRRQSSVSWAEELEMVKEIAPQEGSPAAGSASPLGARLAATNRQHLLLTTFFLMLMVAVLAQRLGLSSML